MIYVNSQPVKDEATEIRKYKKLYLENQRKWTKLGLRTYELDVLQLKKWNDFDAKWEGKPPKGVDVKKWKRQKAFAERKLQFEFAKKWSDLNKEEIKLGNEAQTINEALKELKKSKSSQIMDEMEVNDPKPKKAQNAGVKKGHTQKTMTKPKGEKTPNPWRENYGNNGNGEWDDEHIKKMLDEEDNDPKPKKLLPNKAKIVNGKKGPAHKTMTKAKVENTPNQWRENYGENRKERWDNSQRSFSKDRYGENNER